MTRTVTTQLELDDALASDADVIHINSPAGVWLRLSTSGSATVEASGSATVRASGSATVRAYDSATVEATPHVAVHLHSARAQISGGVVIDISALDLDNAQVWADHVGIEVVDHDGTPTAVLYKVVSPELIAGAEHGRPTTYEPGTEVTAGDWRDDHECGGGLHISPRPFQAKKYRRSESGTRFLKVAAPLAGLRPIGEDKAKSRTVRVLAEVDENGNELAAAGTEKTR
jgi:hypothetical protein